jgi:diacylglycerol kinase (CTP)
VPILNSEPLVPSGVPDNDHLSPTSGAAYYWRQLSRSPSPRLIPIHKSWRSFIHRHEIPRKVLHVSIGFFTLHLYTRGLQPVSIYPWLLGALLPIASVDVLRHNVVGFNRFYVRALGAFMRESEVNDKYNGVIFYLLGAWISMRFFPKDVGVMSILLLSWCDTAASTVGRTYGRYTPQVRKGKSLAGSAAAALVGVLTSLLFLGIVVPSYYGYETDFMYKGHLSLPVAAMNFLGLNGSFRKGISGMAALGVMSVWSGFVASASEVVDLFGLDDNLTIPVLSGLGIWGFLKVFG